jgi:hypothetical protein
METWYPVLIKILISQLILKVFSRDIPEIFQSLIILGYHWNISEGTLEYHWNILTVDRVRTT